MKGFGKIISKKTANPCDEDVKMLELSSATIEHGCMLKQMRGQLVKDGFETGVLAEMTDDEVRDEAYKAYVCIRTAECRAYLIKRSDMPKLMEMLVVLHSN